MPDIIIKSADEMKKYAAELAQKAKAGDIYLLHGNLGAGKTTFAQGFITALQKTKQPVTSPTFNIIQTYDAHEFPVWHCDFYRLKTADDVINLGVEDAFGKAVMLIEWPEVAFDILPTKLTKINIKTLDGGYRKITIS